MKKKMQSPLKKRVARELRCDWRKYLVIAVFLILMIGFVSGMLVANLSMLSAADDGVKKYHQENGHFELSWEMKDESVRKGIESGKQADLYSIYLDKAYAQADQQAETQYPGNDEMKEAFRVQAKEALDEEFEEETAKYNLNPDAEAIPVTIYENFYKDLAEDNDLDGEQDGTIRVFPARDYSNLACVLKGRLPEADDEIAIDRMHADNAGVKKGDTLRVGGRDFRVVGLIAYVNYSCLYEKNTDTMFDALQFDVAMVTEDAFQSLSGKTHYCYAWYYENEPEDEKEEKKLSDAFMKALVTQAVAGDNELVDFVPRYANNAITFAQNDMGKDATMITVILYILIVVIAFVFGITISNTISKEASVIGTLRASGYTRGELLRHYMTMPVIVTLIAAAIGNILGYTLLKGVVVAMYYNSYSLPTYVTKWNPSAFVLTTIIPAVLMIVVNFFIIRKKLKLSPLRFLRHDLGSHKRSKARRLPRWSFMKRFRLRIIFQNMPNYIVLFVGVCFVMIMLAMAVGLPDTLSNYQDRAVDMMIAKHQVVLKSTEDEEGNPIITDTEDAEIFSMHELLRKSDTHDETVSVYGFQPDSRYMSIPEGLAEGEAVISSTFAEKYNLKKGDTLRLEEKYEDKSYSFRVAGIKDYEGSIAVFLPNEEFNRVFGLEAGSFNGYLSDTGIEDIDEEYIAMEITEEDVLKISNQLDHSMGDYMVYFQYLCILLSVVLIYLLTKLIIEKNENAISMVKILGYEPKEIASLYLLSTTVVMLLWTLLGLFVGYFVIKIMWGIILMQMDGWFTYYTSPIGFVKMYAFVMIGYFIVMFMDYRRIKRIPMDEALKNVE